MCWMCSKAEKKIAEEDIKVFKIGKGYEDIFESLYVDFKYQLNQLYTSCIDVEFQTHSNNFIGSQGFHSYDPSIVHLKISENGIIQWAVYAGKRRLDCDTHIGDCVKAECVIPKGSVYYKNDMGEIISNQIIIKNIEPLWN